LLHEAQWIEVREKVRACRNPKDDKCLELAVSGEANCIVSGDEDLLSQDQFRGIPILTPDKFLDALSEDRPEEK
jgi:predicted nucleic acid-binding protein